MTTYLESMAKHVGERMKISGIPPRYLGAEMSHFPENLRATVAKILLTVPIPGAYIVGDVGTGKTHLSCAFCRELLLRGIGTIWTNTTEMVASVKESQHHREDRIHGLLTVRHLILDDFGMEGRSPWEAEIMYRVINGRYNAGKATSCTSNLSPAGSDCRITRRLMDGAILIELKA